ncbi:hypothetical protein B0A48_05333 [Cryoendolithus antarcticus]|uniref:Uncharacterized protein n=1 Tax=Cryoendolithus antarcticus TaxID=1507870 RepID=A0A1V8TIJ6_9PEZI|nr:hypothetical protein B0A48_05333 [Cryoendolithus antarcticus]
MASNSTSNTPPPSGQPTQQQRIFKRRVRAVPREALGELVEWARHWGLASDIQVLHLGARFVRGDYDRDLYDAEMRRYGVHMAEQLARTNVLPDADVAAVAASPGDAGAAVEGQSEIRPPHPGARGEGESSEAEEGSSPTQKGGSSGPVQDSN